MENDRAVSYRRIRNIPENLGTAVNVQAMVFGNSNDNSATGVIFTRNPSTGVDEFLVNAQGEDVVSGVYTPMSIDGEQENIMEKLLPSIYRELCVVCKIPERRASKERILCHLSWNPDADFSVTR